MTLFKRKKKVHNVKRSNKLVGFFIVVMAVALVIGLNMSGNRLREKNNESAAKIEKLQSQIADEKARSEAIDEYSKYVNTKQFVEDVARNKLGLIYADEKIFKGNE